MRVGLDATPLLGEVTGVGRYVAGLLGGLLAAAEPPEAVLTAFTWRRRSGLERYATADGRVRVAGRPAPARLLRELWARTPLPPVEWLAGRLDVFHGTNYVLPPARRAAGVLTVHDLTYLHHPEWVAAASQRYRALVPVALRRAGAVCTVSAAARAQLLDAYPTLVAPQRVVVTPNGVDAAWFTASPPPAQWRAELGLPERYLLFVGTREPRKNLDTLLAAMAGPLAGAQVPPLVVVGAPGWGAPERSPAPAGRVLYTGYVPPDRLAPLVAGAEVFILPSHEEGFGLPVLEAFAAGVPAVLSDIPALREVAGEHARFASPTDPEALGAAVLTTLAEGGPTSPAARRARAREFTWERCARETLRAYRLALG